MPEITVKVTQGTAKIATMATEVQSSALLDLLSALKTAKEETNSILTKLVESSNDQKKQARKTAEDDDGSESSSEEDDENSDNVKKKQKSWSVNNLLFYFAFNYRKNLK